MSKIPPKTFYFVRHGITDANQGRLWCGGDWDIELNSMGLEQANKASTHIPKLNPEIDMIFASPMKRAIQTTTLINTLAQKPVMIVEELREWRIGELEKKPWSNPILRDSMEDWPDPPGGETVIQFRSRIEKALHQCLIQAECPLISSHGAVGRVLINLLGISDCHVDNCHIHKFTPITNSHTVHWEMANFR